MDKQAANTIEAQQNQNQNKSRSIILVQVYTKPSKHKMDNPNQELVKDAKFGHFGYQVLARDLIVPYIYRSNNKLFSISMLEWHLKKRNLFPAHLLILNEFAFIKSRLEIATTHEMVLLDEINLIHNDGIYSEFKTNELLRYVDAAQIAQCQIECSNALRKSHLKCGGFVCTTIRTLDNREFILPYFFKNDKRLVPLILINRIVKGVKWQTYDLNNIELIYMKFLTKLIACDMDFSQPTLSCVSVNHLLDHFQLINSEYWPKETDRFENTIAKKIGENNNTQQTDSKKPGSNNNIGKHKPNNDFYEVEKIIRCRKYNGGAALVRWKGYSPIHDSWVPISDLSEDLQDEAMDLLQKKRLKH